MPILTNFVAKARKMKKGLIIGKGWLGQRLENKLNHKYQFVTTKRNADAENCIAIDFDEPTTMNINVDSFDFILILIPFGRRNSEEVLINRFNQISEFIKGFKKQIFLISSTGIYPDLEMEIDENSIPNDELIKSYSTIERLMQNNFPQLIILRLGGLMGDDRYLSKYINETSPNLNSVVNHIHYQDVIEIIHQLIEKNITQETYNITTSLKPNKQQVISHQLNKKINHNDTKIGKSISPKKIINELNYQFIYPNPIYFQD